MSYIPLDFHRRSIRLEGYDYSQPGAYFLTICIHTRVPLLGRVVEGVMQPTPAGEMVLATWTELGLHDRDLRMDEFIVMPDHIHGLLILESSEPVGARQPGDHACFPAASRMGSACRSVSEVVRRFKTLTTRRYIHGVQNQDWPRFHGRLWQRNFHESIIRNDTQLNRVRRYIRCNPAQWKKR